MATRIKTVEYAFGSRNTNLALNTRYDATAITVYLPETTSRTFRSVRLQVFVRDNVTTAVNLGTTTVGIKLGAAAFDNANLSVQSTTGENASYVIERDVTSYFTTNFGTGGSQTCQYGVQFSTAATINISAKLIVTYEYDDTDATHVKTVRITLDSPTAALTATLAEVGTNQIPALDTVLGESSKVYRNIWFELTYQEATTGTTNDASLGMQVDTGTEHLTGIHESGLASSPMGRYIWDQGASPAWSTASAHAFKLRSSNITTASVFTNVAIQLCVTYEYAANSSRITNTVALIFPHINHSYGAAEADAARTELEFWIEEPGTITMIQSGVFLALESSAAIATNLKVGGGTSRSYAKTAVLECGGNFITQRCDSGGAGGSSWTLARGLNRFKLDIWQGASGVNNTCYCPILYLNYTSDNDGNGGSRHNQTLIFNLFHANTGGQTNNVYTCQQMAWLPDTDGWFVNNLGLMSWSTNGASGNEGIMLSMEAGSGEKFGDNFVPIAEWIWWQDSELHCNLKSCDLTSLNLFDRWRTDPEASTRWALDATRRIAYAAMIHWNVQLYTHLTKHSITKAVAGDITGSSGGTVAIECYTERFGLVASTSRVGNGAFSMVWYDDAETNTKVWARESASLVGGSNEAAAGT